MERGTCVVCSSHVNAVGLALGLREAGFNGRIVCLNLNGTSSPLARRWPGLCEYGEWQLAGPDELPGRLREAFGIQEPLAVFFTDERFLPVFAAKSAHDLLPCGQWHVGCGPYLDVILDRRLFYEFLEDRGLARVPRTVGSDQDPWQSLGSQFRVRVWQSWRGMSKLPRGLNVHSRAEHEGWLRTCAEARLRPDEWGYQELLSTLPSDNVSVCGWHDPEFQFYITTRKVLVANENGWVVERVSDHAELHAQAGAILAALEYSGPFELEYVRDSRTDCFMPIELNPRFWMQHRLTGVVGGNCLVRRYLGMPLDQTAPSAQRAKRFWVETDVALARMLTLVEPELFRYLSAAVWSHSLDRATIGHALRGARHQLTARLRSAARGVQRRLARAGGRRFAAGILAAQK